MKDFAPYQQSLELKELGFDEPCFANYTVIFPEDKIDWFTIPEQGITNKTSFGSSKNYNSKYFEEEGTISAPTYSQAFRWFREKYNVRHNIMDFIDDEVGIEWDYEIATIGTDLDENGNYKPLVDYSTDDKDRKFKTYEEAELACLNKLIEIVKDEK